LTPTTGKDLGFPRRIEEERKGTQAETSQASGRRMPKSGGHRGDKRASVGCGGKDPSMNVGRSGQLLAKWILK